jgi:hypothetical protein
MKISRAEKKFILNVTALLFGAKQSRNLIYWVMKTIIKQKNTFQRWGSHREGDQGI